MDEEKSSLNNSGEPAVGCLAAEESAVDDSHIELSAAELAAVFSNLAKGCEKQRLSEEAAAFGRLADYYTGQMEVMTDSSFTMLADMLTIDLADGLSAARASAEADQDRGAKRSLVWSEKVSLVGQALLTRFVSDGEAMLIGKKVFVCEICGFVFIGDAQPNECPICRVPGFRIAEVGRS